MSSVAAATDAPEEFAALADEVVEDFMSDATSNEVFSTAEGHGEVSYEIMPHVQDHRVTSRVALLPRRVLQNLLCDAGFREPVWQTRLRRATTASLAEEVGEWYSSGAEPQRIVQAALAAHAEHQVALQAVWAAVLASEDLLPYILGALNVHIMAVPLTCRLWRSIWATLPVTLLRLVAGHDLRAVHGVTSGPAPSKSSTSIGEDMQRVALHTSALAGTRSTRGC